MRIYEWAGHPLLAARPELIRYVVWITTLRVLIRYDGTVLAMPECFDSGIEEDSSMWNRLWPLE